MPETILINGEERMEQTLVALQREFSTVRSGRANPKMLERVNVDYYGVMSPLNQIASIQIPEATQIFIKPYDKSLLSKIERAIFAANLGVTPTNDGTGIRIFLPPLTEENRREAVKVVRRMSEDAKVAIRNVRRDLIADFKKLEKDKAITEDDLRFYQEEAQKLTDKFIEKIDDIFKEKEKDIMSI
ncbi:MAG: ribosome recycling factor [Candidatus Izemoplasmatales bacterium]